MINMYDFAPDLIFHNGLIYTLDEHNSCVQAVAVKAGRILTTGSDQQLLPLAAPHTQCIDLGGKAVIPGLFDSHNHLQQVGVKLTRISLEHCQSPEEMMTLVRERAEITPPGHWIVGEGWNEANFGDGRLPTRHDIDPATDQHPVILMRFFNTDVVNSVGLRLAGISRQTADPEGGKIEHDASGEPNGLLRAAAKLLVRRLLPQPTLAELSRAVRLGCQEMNRYGITSIIDPGLMPHEVQAYQQVYRAGELTVRSNLMLSWHGFREEETAAQLDARAAATGLVTGLGDEWLRLGGLKMAIDGGTSSRTAYMYEPFEGEHEVRNYNRLDTNDLLRYFRTAQELGWDVGIHVTGDRALDMAVDAFAQVAREIPQPDARHNLIHAYFPSDRAIAQMAQYNLAAVIQPTFLYWEGDMIFRDVGQHRAANYKPARKYLDHGVRIAANSDIPSTTSVNPFVALYALVTRKNNLGHFIAADQAISRGEALRAYTIWGAWLTREERVKGSIEVGKVADFVVLDQDYFTVPHAAIKDLYAEMTVVGGQVVWRSGG